jgi:transposase
MAMLTKLPPSKVAMEACGAAHYIGRAAQALGHEVRLTPPEYVIPNLRKRDSEGLFKAGIV